MMNSIALVTLNARYTHSSLALRYLKANLGELKDNAVILEFVINENITSIAEKILSNQPAIIGIATYIWNASDVKKLVNTLKKIAPGTIVVLGGPEVSHLPMRVDYENADYIIQGEGESEFRRLCSQIISGIKPESRIIKCEPADLSEIKLPYEYYTDEDIKNRVIYVEASRGCPFKCEFCLSSIDKTVRYFDMDIFMREIDTLWRRGVRKFKFIDRTFNLNIKYAELLLDYFLSKEPPYFIHFEVVPDNFPDTLKEKLRQFPPASLQLEAGIQTLNPDTAVRISRKMDFDKIKDNLLFLSSETRAHLHADLIIGLPGESLNAFADNLNVLCSWTNSEIQLGILKKLSGTSIDRHDIEYKMIYSDEPPYEILQNSLIPFDMMQKMKRFARFWDITYNSGNFNKSVSVILKNDKSIFNSFFSFSEWIYEQTESTWHISLERMAELIFNYLTDELKISVTEAANLLIQDILKIEGRKLPAFLRSYADNTTEIKKNQLSKINKRQIKHIDSE